MNFSIFLKLMTAYYKKSIRIKPKYKHLNYLLDNGWLRNVTKRIKNELRPGVIMAPYTNIPTNEYVLTTKGKEALFNFKSNLLTRFLSILALIISILGYLK